MIAKFTLKGNHFRSHPAPVGLVSVGECVVEAGRVRREIEVELPPPSAELVLIRVFVQSYLATCDLPPGERASAFLRHASGLLADEDSLSRVMPIRPPSGHAAVAKARLQALVLYEGLLPTFIAELPRG